MVEDLALGASPSPSGGCCAAPDAASASVCVLCARAICARCAALVNGKTTCAACRDAVLAEIAREAESGSTAAPAGAGAAAAVGAGAAWAALSVLTGSEIGIAAVGVGWAVGHAVRFAAGGRRGPVLQRIAVACAASGLTLGKYLIVAHAVREMVARRPGAAPDQVPGYFDAHMPVFFLSVLPRIVTFYDALWVFLAFSAAWRILKPAAVAIADARGNSAPAA
ncbi:MAG: hypothetical protein HY079_14205 [Elusimicrobia bacterium]|nr:hypothetical protein [Elusimicrobiota bacterium]